MNPRERILAGAVLVLAGFQAFTIWKVATLSRGLHEAPSHTAAAVEEECHDCAALAMFEARLQMLEAVPETVGAADDSLGAAGGAPPGDTARQGLILDDLRYRFPEIDLDKDGQVSVKEFDGSFRDFLFFDENESGTVTLTEIEAVQSDLEKAQAWVGGLDRNADGRVSPAEFDRTPRQFRAVDADGDGFITAREHVLSGRKIETRIRIDDIDRDFKISRIEFRGGAAAFEHYDQDRDGFLDHGEVRRLVSHGQD